MGHNNIENKDRANETMGQTSRCVVLKNCQWVVIAQWYDFNRLNLWTDDLILSQVPDVADICDDG
jgi:hypothetical protein